MEDTELMEKQIAQQLQVVFTQQTGQEQPLLLAVG